MALCIVWSSGPATIALSMMPPDADALATANHRDQLIARGMFTPSQFTAIIDATLIPQSRYFRPAWKWSAGACVSDLPRARVRHVQKLRKVRNNLLSASDIQVNIAQDAANTIRLANLQAYRVSLRNMPVAAAPLLAACSATASIRLVIPPILTIASP